MTQETQLRYWKLAKLFPHIKPELAVVSAINLTPGVTLAAGTVLGPVSTAANDVQTISATGTVSGGTYSITFTDPFTGLTYTLAGLAYNAAKATIAAAIAAVPQLNGNLTLGGGELPTTPLTVRGAGRWVGMPIPPAVLDIASLTGGGSYGVVHTTTGRSAHTYNAYTAGNSDGTQLGRCILPYDVKVDAMGGIAIGDQATDQWGATMPYVEAYFAGYFRAADLVGADANLVTLAGWRIVSGTVTAGLIALGL